MKSTQGKELIIKLGQHYATIQEALNSDTNLQGTVTSWNLKALDSINVVDSINDDRQRKEVAFKRKRKNNVLTWALVGGLVDASSGDDSIIDGVLLGGMFGYASSGSVEKPEARILLTFTNGDKLGVIVDQDELLQVLEVKQEDNLIDGKFVRSLSKTQKDVVLDSRRLDEQTSYLILACLCLFGGFFLNGFLNLTVEDVPHGQLLLNFATWGIGLTGLGFALLGCGVLGRKSKECYLKDGEQ